MPDGPSPTNYQRPREGFRFTLGGIKTNSVPDAIPDGKYAYCQNLRTTRHTSARLRAGLKWILRTVATAITDLRAYTILGSDDSPYVVIRNAADAIYVGNASSLDSASLAGSLAVGPNGPTPGASLVPFRPAQSPNPWMYAANGADYQKFSAPDAALGGVVTQQKVGIAEPQSAPDAAIFFQGFNNFLMASASITHAGTSGAPSDTTRISDTVQSVFKDPASIQLYTVGVTASSTKVYTKEMIIQIGSGNFAPVLDVFPAQPTPIAVSAVYYYSGTTGTCVVVPNTVQTGPGDGGQSIYTQNLLGSLRRGAIVQFSGSSEKCLVLSVTEGPNGSICFETSTTGTHAAGETITLLPAIQFSYNPAPTVAAAITSSSVTATMTGSGVGTLTQAAGIPGFFNPSSLQSFQPEDYLHFSINIATLASINEVKFLLDVGDGSFTQNFYFYTVRVSDIEASVQNTLTQLGAAQLVAQRATIDEENTAKRVHGSGLIGSIVAAANQLATSSSAQTTPGDGQWAEVIFPISALTRVGNDQTKTLNNLVKVQFLFNTNATTVVQVGEFSVFGSYQPDVGTNGAPYLYRVRPRSSVTGVKGNPSPATRYGCNPRRTEVVVTFPSAAYDSQIDTWDVFRYGGSVTSWRKIGQTAISNSTFNDNYSDATALEGEELEFDNLEPWPTIGLPLNANALTVVGTTAVVNIPSGSPTTVDALRYLPGNLVRIGGTNVYTLRQRPTLLTGSNYLFQFVENAGALNSAPVLIYEPAMARQFLPYMWGPDAAGTVFACGDPLRPGTFYFAKNYAPDAAPDRYNQEITPPSEPLLGGEIIGGLSYVASPQRWWALYPQQNAAQRYSVIQQPLQRGLATPFGHCNDGKHLYWWAKDGIWSSAKGSLTDADLYNLFPHEGVAGTDRSYGGYTVYAPDYKRAGTFRLAYCNSYLYATYQDSTGTPRCLTYDIRNEGWMPDVYHQPPTVFYAPETQEGSVQSSAKLYPLLLAGDTQGIVAQPVDLTDDTYPAAAFPAQGIIATREWDGGDLRAGEEWGDLWLYLMPATPVIVQPMALGAALGAPTTIPSASGAVVQLPVSLGGGVLSNFLGVMLSWIDDYENQSTPTATVLQAWQPSFLPKPETIADRFSDWYDGGTERAKYVQGFLLHADTFNAAKGLAVRDSDTLTTHPFTPAVRHNGESILAYSFVTPFLAHMMRLEPTDQAAWRFFDVDWVFEPTAEAAETWQTQGTAFGLVGYMHVKQVSACYASTQPVTLVITSFDGQSPQPVTLPATGGAMQKVTFILTANKGQLYFFAATSSAPFQLFLDSWEIQVGQWQRQDQYLRYRSLGGITGDRATV